MAINPEHIHIGSLLRTNKGEIIKVESITTKHHRKVGYHKEGDAYHIHYVRLCQCEIVETPITEELLEENGWDVRQNPRLDYIADSASLYTDTFYAEFTFGRNSLNIWLHDKDGEVADEYSDLYVRVCDTLEKLNSAFQILNIDYKLCCQK